MRTALAQALFIDPDLLLLVGCSIKPYQLQAYMYVAKLERVSTPPLPQDEPTNALDLPCIIWLQVRSGHHAGVMFPPWGGISPRGLI